MILVLLGTQNNNFNRLLEELQNCIDKKLIADEVVVQAGFTKFESKDMKIFDFIDKDEMSKLVEKADLIITHGGVGSIILALKNGKKTIVVPRSKKNDEHVNSHQFQIAKRFEKEGYVKSVVNIKNLGKVIKSMDNFVPKAYEKRKSDVITLVENFIDNN